MASKQNRKISDHAGVIIPPPVLFGLGVVIGLMVDAMTPAHLGFPGSPLLWRIVGLAAILSAMIVAGWAVFTFHRAGTNILPHHPTIKIVASGPYRLSRNPMYVALILLYCGLGLVTDNPWLLMGLIVILPVLNIGIVRREERYLTAKFGSPYEDYCARVGRWF